MSLVHSIPDVTGILLDMRSAAHTQPDVPEFLPGLRIDHAEAIGRHLMNCVEFKTGEFEAQLRVAQTPGLECLERSSFAYHGPVTHALCFSICSACRSEVSVRLAPESIRAISSTRCP